MSVSRETPFPSVSTSSTLGLLKAARYVVWKPGRLHMNEYHVLSFSAVARSCTVFNVLSNFLHVSQMSKHH